MLSIAHINRRRRIGGGGGETLTDQVVAFFGSGEEGGVWDFTDASNLATATDGTGAVTDGSAIAYCADLSGNGNHLLQATAGSRPTWSNTGYAAFANDFMNVVWPLVAQPVTRLHRSYLGSWGTQQRLLSGDLAGRQISFQFSSSPLVYFSAGGTSVGVSVPLTQYNTLVEVFNGASSSLRVNGADNSLSTGTVGSAGLAVAAEAAGTNSHANSRYVRIMVINRELTSEELTTAEAWLEEVL